MPMTAASLAGLPEKVTVLFLSGLADERHPVAGFVGAGAFADDHQTGG